MDEERKLLNFNLNCLHLFGYNVLKKPNIFRRFSKMVYLICNIISYILAILYFVYDVEELTIADINDLLETFASCTQVKFVLVNWVFDSRLLKVIWPSLSKFYDKLIIFQNYVQCLWKPLRVFKVHVNYYLINVHKDISRL